MDIICRETATRELCNPRTLYPGVDCTAYSIKKKIFRRCSTVRGGQLCNAGKERPPPPPALRNRPSCYQHILKGDVRNEFEGEVERWIKVDIIIPWNEVKSGMLPQMVVVQQKKGKIRTVLDFRELNGHVTCHADGEMTGVCKKTFRESRRMTEAATIIDFKSAYLEFYMSRKLWKYQAVKCKG